MNIPKTNREERSAQPKSNPQGKKHLGGGEGKNAKEQNHIHKIQFLRYPGCGGSVRLLKTSKGKTRS